MFGLGLLRPRLNDGPVCDNRAAEGGMCKYTFTVTFLALEHIHWHKVILYGDRGMCARVAFRGPYSTVQWARAELVTFPS